VASWKGKSRGGVLGYKIFVFILKYMGLRAAYLLLVFVSFYFVLFSVKSTKSIFVFFRKRLKKSLLKSVWGVYKTYYVFGQALIDRTAVLAGMGNRFTYEFDGENFIREIAEGGEGGVLISAHAGNWSMAGNRLDKNMPDKARVNIVMMADEHKKIQDFLDKTQSKQTANIIGIGDDFSHIIAMSLALRNGELLCMHGDRYMPGSETVVVDFFGKKTHLPSGPFQLAVRMKVPCAVVYAFKETANHYHFYSTPPLHNPASVQEAAQYFATSMEEKIRIYPYQWYNFYDFWAAPQPVILERKGEKKTKKKNQVHG
jgi:predicted LPLAT superfamily acyltransferase